MKNYTLIFRAVDKGNFEKIRNGLKSIETRAATIKYQPIEVGDTLTFVCDDERFTKKIIKKFHWPSIDAMVEEVDFKRVMPAVESVEEMKKEYASYPDYDEKIKQYGLFGFELE